MQRNEFPLVRTWQVRARLLARHVGRSKPFYLRVLACFLVGLIPLWIQPVGLYDFRFRLRGPQPTSKNVVLITINDQEWTALVGNNRNLIRPVKEVINLTDSFFWQEWVWERLLRTVLDANPKIVGVTFYFGSNISPVQISSQTEQTFTDPRILWGSDLNANGTLLPRFTGAYKKNIGLALVRPENDGIVRYFYPKIRSKPHLALRLAQLAGCDCSEIANEPPNKPLPINYFGPAGTFPHYSISDVLAHKVPASELKGKIVLIGATGVEPSTFLTPVGKMPKVEILANMVDDLLLKHWIVPSPTPANVAYLGLLLALAIAIISYYPQTVALFFFGLIGLFVTAISAWIFDSYCFWIPALAPVILLTGTYIIFVGYLLTQKEQLTWRLEQEQKYILELEQLKHNFVSLFSHDLKTPIARIQAVVDRIMNQNPEANLRLDLLSIRKSSDDLHRYIQSILRMTRVESRDFKLHKEVVDLNALIEQAVQDLRQMAIQKNIELQCQLEPLFSIEADPSLIYEVILNLIENALKYTPEHGKVVVTSRELPDRITVSVDDTGPGIATAERERIWGKFYRGEHHSLNTKGSGLGLYLVKYFIELHGGDVFLETQKNVGTQIGFSLPLASLA